MRARWSNEMQVLNGVLLRGARYGAVVGARDEIVNGDSLTAFVFDRANDFGARTTFSEHERGLLGRDWLPTKQREDCGGDHGAGMVLRQHRQSKVIR